MPQATWLHDVPLVWRVFAVVVIALIPLLAALVVDTYNDEQAAQAALITRTRDLEARVAVREEGVLAEMHGFLRPLVALPLVREGVLGECAPVLQEVRQSEPRLAALAVYQDDLLLCRGDGLLEAAPFLEDAVVAARQQPAFMVAPAAWDERIQDWVLPFALAVGPEVPGRIVAGALSLETLRDQFSALATDEGAHILLFDTVGNLLVDTGRTALRETQALFAEATQDQVSWRASPNDAPFLYTARVIQAPSDQHRELMVVGLPLGPVEAATDRLLFARAALGLSALGIGGVFAAWTMAATIRAPLRAIDGASRRVTAGDLSARMEVPHAPREFRALETSFNAMAEALDGLERTRADLFNHISHQVRTPLTRLILSQEVLRLALDSGDLDAARRNAATGLRATQELRAKTEKLDALAQALLARRGAAFQPLDLAALTDEVQAAIAAAAPGRAVSCHASGDKDARVKAHAPSLRRAVQELVENAQRHGGPLAIRVTVQAWRHDVRIQVHDEGPGMPDHALAALQAPLMEGHAEDLAESGFGIGLRLARLVAQLFGGRLEVESGHGDDRTSGTTVTLVLPRSY